MTALGSVGEVNNPGTMNGGFGAINGVLTRLNISSSHEQPFDQLKII